MLLLSAELSWLRGPDQRRIETPARILVLTSDPDWRHLLPGQRLTATGRLQAARGGDLTAAVLSANSAPVRLGASSWMQRAAGSLRAGLQRACLPLADEPGGLLPGLVVGDTSRLLPAVEEDFLATGMTLCRLNIRPGVVTCGFAAEVLLGLRASQDGVLPGVSDRPVVARSPGHHLAG
jgi:competence protein ComEC